MFTSGHFEIHALFYGCDHLYNIGSCIKSDEFLRCVIREPDYYIFLHV